MYSFEAWSWEHKFSEIWISPGLFFKSIPQQFKHTKEFPVLSPL